MLLVNHARVKLPHWNRAMRFNRERHELGFDSDDWTWLKWIPSQDEIMSDEWELSD
jgi:hypothetical protein